MIAKFMKKGTPVLMKNKDDLKMAVQEVFGIQLQALIPAAWEPVDWFVKRTDTERICCFSVHVTRMISHTVMIYVIHANKNKRNRRSFGFDIGMPFRKNQEQSMKRGLAFCRNVLKKMSSLGSQADMRIYLEKVANDMDQKDWSA